MRKLNVLLAVALLTATSVCAKTVQTITDYYSFRMTLKVPQVINNTTSQGKRGYQIQYILGELSITYFEDGSVMFDLYDLYNKKFKVNGGKVTYNANIDYEKIYPRLTYIGNNKTERFTTATLAFFADFYPSYAKGEAGEDNSFLLQFAGRGSTSTSLAKGCRLPKMFVGYCAGTQGCSCSAYSHKSPTRKATWYGPSSEPDDVAATWGTWKATFIKSTSRRCMRVLID